MAAPKLITRRTLAREAASRWAAQYGPRWGLLTIGDSYEIHAEIVSLGADPDPDDVNRTIGNDWTSVPECSACESRGLPVVVQVGEALDYESATAFLCPDCLREALALVASADVHL